MNQEIEFAKTLERLRGLAREQDHVLSEEQIDEAFRRIGLELSKEKMELVHDYLRKHGIGIGEPVDVMERLTEEDTDYLELYLRELETLEIPEGGEQEAVILSAMAGDGQARNRLIELYLPKVVEIARIYAGQGIGLEDLIGEGNAALMAGVGLLGCLEGPDEVPGMLGKMIMGAMEELIARTAEESELDRQLLAIVNTVNDKARELAESLLRKVSVEELAQETGMDAEEIREALRISAARIEYLEPEETA